MTPKKTDTPPSDEPPDDVEAPSGDRVLTIRVGPELYEAVVTESRTARHSINTGATILLEEALSARGKWPPGDAEPEKSKAKAKQPKIPPWMKSRKGEPE